MNTPTLDKIHLGLIEAQERNINPDSFFMDRETATKLQSELKEDVTNGLILFGMKSTIDPYAADGSVIYYDSSIDQYGSVNFTPADGAAK